MMCTGTLVEDSASTTSSRWVLTAAHCGSSPKDLTARFFVSCGEDQYENLIPVSEVHRHPEFQFGDRNNDIALMELEDEIKQNSISHVYSFNQIESLVKEAQAYHHFQVKTIDNGVTGGFGRPRFVKEYTFDRQDTPLIRCAAVGMGYDEDKNFGHLQSQGLGLVFFLDLGMHHLLLSLNDIAHGVHFQPGDSGGPLFCQLEGDSESFVLGVNSHSMENQKYSFATPTFRYRDWIREVQSRL